MGPRESELELSLLTVSLILDIALASEEDDRVVVEILGLGKDLDDYLGVVANLKLL